MILCLPRHTATSDIRPKTAEVQLTLTSANAGMRLMLVLTQH
jgi:hypothetical protein